jgi:hypothetical protein
MASRFAQLVTEFVTTLNDPSVKVLSGRREVDSTKNAPRVVCIPMGGPIEAPDKPGGELLPNGQRAKRIAIRKLKVEVECWGKDQETAEALYFNALNAWRKMTHASVEFGEEQWPSQEEGSDGRDKAGEIIKFTIIVTLPIFSGQIPLGTPTVTPAKVLKVAPDFINKVKLDEGNPEDPLNQEDFTQT